MVITSLEKGRSEKIHIYVDGEYMLTVTVEMCLRHGLKKDMSLTSDDVEALKFEYESALAKNKALDLLSLRSHSEFELLQKLRRKFCEEACEYAVSEMRRIDLVDDFKFAEMYAERLFEDRKMGVFRIRRELEAKGVAGDIIDEVVSRYDCVDVHSKLYSLIQKKYASCLDGEKELRRTVASLVRLGYGYGDVYAAIKEYKNDNEYGE